MQLLGSAHWIFKQVPPPTGHNVTLYLAQGPPVGGVMVMAAVVGLVGLGTSEGTLQWAEESYFTVHTQLDMIIDQNTARP